MVLQGGREVVGKCCRPVEREGGGGGSPTKYTIPPSLNRRSRRAAAALPGTIAQRPPHEAPASDFIL